MKNSRALAAFSLLAAALQAMPALAADKINHCQTITQSGSYVVTKNLSASGDCIVVKANFVTIDLDGFLVEGNGTGGGITDLGAFTNVGVTVRNGTVSNFSNGVSFVSSTGVVVERITSAGNTNVGIVLVSGISASGLEASLPAMFPRAMTSASWPISAPRSSAIRWD